MTPCAGIVQKLSHILWQGVSVFVLFWLVNSCIRSSYSFAPYNVHAPICYQDAVGRGWLVADDFRRFDGDNDVDLEDFGRFQACVSG